MVDITVEGYTKPFKCPVGWTVKEAKDEIREEYALMNGGIKKGNGEATKSTDIIQEGESYVFVCPEKKQNAPQPPPPGK